MPGCDFAFRDAVGDLRRLGPRPTGELLGEVMAAVPEGAPVIAERLDIYGRLDPYTVTSCETDDWLDAAAVVRLVEGGGR